MKESDSNNNGKCLGKELDKLRKENEKLKLKLQSQKEANRAEIKNLKRELKKKDVPKRTLTDEQRKLLSSLFRDIDSLFS